MSVSAEARGAELEAELPNVVERRIRLGAKRIILFGSLAEGKVGRASDIDLLVVLDGPGRYMDRLGAVYDAMRPAVAVAALVLTPEEFEELRQTRPFIKRIAERGRVLHEA